MSLPDRLQLQQDLSDLLERYAAHQQMRVEPHILALYLIQCLDNLAELGTNAGRWPPHGVEPKG